MDYFTHTLNQIGFWVKFYQAAVGGLYSCAQIVNPAGSSILMVVDDIWVQTVANVNYWIQLRSWGTALNVGMTERNKYLGGAAPIGQGWQEALGALPGTVMFECYTTNAPNKPFYPIPFRNPFIIPEGEGLVLSCANVNTDLSGGFHWLEIPKP